MFAQRILLLAIEAAANGRNEDALQLLRVASDSREVREFLGADECCQGVASLNSAKEFRGARGIAQALAAAEIDEVEGTMLDVTDDIDEDEDYELDDTVPGGRVVGGVLSQGDEIRSPVRLR